MIYGVVMYTDESCDHTVATIYIRTKVVTETYWIEVPAASGASLYAAARSVASSSTFMSSCDGGYGIWAARPQVHATEMYELMDKPSPRRQPAKSSYYSSIGMKVGWKISVLTDSFSVL